MGQEKKPTALRKATSISRGDKKIPGIPDDLLGNILSGPMDPPSLGPIFNAIAAIDPKLAKFLGKALLDRVPDVPVKAALRRAQERYPRLFGHVTDIRTDLQPNSSMTGYQRSTADDLVTPSQIARDGGPRSKRTSVIALRPDAKDETVFHELTHAAQQLRGGQSFNRGYRTATASQGYTKNPFEQSARFSGNRAQYRDEILARTKLPQETRDSMAFFRNLSPQDEANLYQWIEETGGTLRQPVDQLKALVTRLRRFEPGK